MTRRSQLRRASRVETSRVQHVRTTTQSKALHARMDGSFQMTMRASWPAPVNASSRRQLSSCSTVSAEHAMPMCSAVLRGDGQRAPAASPDAGDDGDGGDGAPKGMFIAVQRLVAVSFLFGVCSCAEKKSWGENGRSAADAGKDTHKKKKVPAVWKRIASCGKEKSKESDDTISEMEAMERLCVSPWKNLLSFFFLSHFLLLFSFLSHFLCFVIPSVVSLSQ